MGVGLGGRGKRRRNIGQNHGGAKDGGGVNVLQAAAVNDTMWVEVSGYVGPWSWSLER